MLVCVLQFFCSVYVYLSSEQKDIDTVMCSVGAHGARPVGNHTDAVTGESDNCSALDMDISSDDATTEYSNESDSGSEPDEITSTADSHAVTSKRFGNRSTGRAALPR